MIVETCFTQLFYLIGVDILRMSGNKVSIIAKCALLLVQLCGTVVVSCAVNPLGIISVAAEYIAKALCQ